MQSLLQQASSRGDTRVALGLDSKQLAGTSAAQRGAAGQHLRPGEIIGAGHGYFKLAQGREGDAVSADGLKGMLLRLTAGASLLGAHPLAEGMALSCHQ